MILLLITEIYSKSFVCQPSDSAARSVHTVVSMELPYPSRPETVHAAQVFGSVQNQRNAGEALLFDEYRTCINNLCIIADVGT